MIPRSTPTSSCFQWFKDTNSKANHNYIPPSDNRVQVVFNGSKILIRKQITTGRLDYLKENCCFQWFKDTNSKANHNQFSEGTPEIGVVFNGSKILIRKQITTVNLILSSGCALFSMVQRY